MRFSPDLKMLVNVEEKSASPVHNPANEPDLSGLPYTPSATCLQATFTCKSYLSTSSVPEPSDQNSHTRFTNPSASPPRDDAFITSLHQCTLQTMQSNSVWLLKKRR